MTATAAPAFKDQGNIEFKAGNWLKAAALYSKGLKDDPGNAVLLSNRSAALLKLNKVQKALADAEECITCKPDWEKGYFRKGNVLESVQKFDQALDAYQEAAKRSPGSKEVANKVKSLSRLVRTSAAHTSQSSQKMNGMISTSQAYDSANSSMRQGSVIPSSAERTEEFGRQILDLVDDEIQRKTFDRTFPAVYFLPGRQASDCTEKMGQVSIQAAFDSPETLASAIDFLRKYAADSEGQAAVAVVPKHRIAYPQVWQKASWPLGKTAEGIFVQLEAPSTRKVWFLPLGQRNREPVALKDRFALFEALFR